MARGASFHLVPRPRSQPFLRKVGWICGSLTLLLSALIFLIAVFYRSDERLKHLVNVPSIDPADLRYYARNQIVQPLFTERTKFDVIISIWSPSTGEDQVLWEGVLQRNVDYGNGTSQEQNVTVELDLTHLVSLEEPSLLATVILVPHMNTTSLTLPGNSHLISRVDQVETYSIPKSVGCPLNLSPLKSKQLVYHFSDGLRQDSVKSASLSAHSVPLLYVKKQTKKSSEILVNTRIEIAVEYQTSSYERNQFLRVQHGMADLLEKSKTHDPHRVCYENDYPGPLQTLLEFVSSNDTAAASGSSRPLRRGELARSFYVPYLVLQTSSLPSELVHVSPDSNSIFNWNSTLQTTELSRALLKLSPGRRGQAMRRIELQSRMESGENSRLSKVDPTGFAFAIWLISGFTSFVLEVSIALFGLLYWYTRATSVGISRPAALLTCTSMITELLGSFLYFKSISLPEKSCDLLLTDKEHWFFSAPGLILAFQQLWFISRLRLERYGTKWPFWRLRKTLEDHSERQSARQHEKVTLGLQFGLLVCVVILLIYSKPDCLLIQQGGVGLTLEPLEGFDLLLYVFPLAGRVLGELLQLDFNRRRQSFAGAFKTAVTLHAIRHAIEISSEFYFDSSSVLSSRSRLITESFSVILTASWLQQMLCYEPIQQVRDEDLHNEVEL